MGGIGKKIRCKLTTNNAICCGGNSDRAIEVDIKNEEKQFHFLSNASGEETFPYGYIFIFIAMDCQSSSIML